MFKLFSKYSSLVNNRILVVLTVFMCWNDFQENLQAVADVSRFSLEVHMSTFCVRVRCPVIEIQKKIH